MHNEDTRDPLRNKLDLIANAPKGRLTKNDVVRRLSKILERVNDAMFLRQVENARAGRDEAEDDLFAALDMAETELFHLGALPRAKNRTIPEDNE
jgi:hypothetical protein